MTASLLSLRQVQLLQPTVLTGFSFLAGNDVAVFRQLLLDHVKIICISQKRLQIVLRSVHSLTFSVECYHLAYLDFHAKCVHHVMDFPIVSGVVTSTDRLERSASFVLVRQQRKLANHL